MPLASVEEPLTTILLLDVIDFSGGNAITVIGGTVGIAGTASTLEMTLIPVKSPVIATGVITNRIALPVSATVRT